MNIAGIQFEIVRVSAELTYGRQEKLSFEERRELELITHPKRRQAFLAGRDAAKRLLVRAFPDIQPTRITITTRNTQHRGISPVVIVDGKRWEGSLSISHTDEWAIAGLSADQQNCVGVDIARVEARPASFARTWFSESEQESLALWDEANLVMAWAAKEAVFKAWNCGESFQPREMVVSNSSAASALCVQWRDSRCEANVSRYFDHVVAVAVVDQQLLVNKSA